MKEGFMIEIKYSLLARSVPVLLIGNDLGVTLQQSYGVSAVFVVVLILISNKIVRYVDYKEISRGEE